MKYTILSMCCGDFYDAFDVIVPSWFTESVENIVVYTDRDFDYPGVEIRPKVKHTTDWIEAVGLKTGVVKDFLQTCDCDNLVFMDMDSFVTRDLAPIYEHDFDVAACHKQGSKTTAAGNWYARVSGRLHSWVRAWSGLQAEYFRQGKGLKPHRPSYHQRSFTDTLKMLDVYYAPGELWNSRRSLYSNNNGKWARAVEENNPYILHFIHEGWRDKELVRRILTASDNAKEGE